MISHLKNDENMRHFLHDRFKDEDFKKISLAIAKYEGFKKVSLAIAKDQGFKKAFLLKVSMAITCFLYEWDFSFFYFFQI